MYGKGGFFTDGDRRWAAPSRSGNRTFAPRNSPRIPDQTGAVKRPDGELPGAPAVRIGQDGVPPLATG